MRPRIIVFASGTAEGGGSGFENLVTHSRGGDLQADIVTVVSNHEHGGVHERAERLSIPFVYFPGPFTASEYQRIVREAGGEWIALSGWLKHVEGLDPARTFNIHPALLSQLGGRFGGAGMYGHRVHEQVKAALDAGEIDHSGVTMHFVTPEYDRGPAFFEYQVPLASAMNADEIGKVVNAAEHLMQPRITNMVVHGEISWDGRDPASLTVPEGYAYLSSRNLWSATSTSC